MELLKEFPATLMSIWKLKVLKIKNNLILLCVLNKLYM